MRTIKLNKIICDGSIVKYVFSFDKSLNKYFSGKDFIIEYPISIADIPTSILAIPFVCNVLPIVWLTDSVLELEELDLSFYNCISRVKQGYIDMYPNMSLGGRVIVKNITENHYEITNRSAMFYSGGLDSVQTLISHYKENPLLLSVWGSDIHFDNTDGWNKVHRTIIETSKLFDLQELVIHSTFREFDNEYALDYDYNTSMGDGYWHGIKHSLALIGHVAPIAYVFKINCMYFASTFCKNDKNPKCASLPSTDNNIAFCSCKVYHDGFEFSRQDKIHNLIRFCNSTQKKINLHVCWQSFTGNNCCCCEKCYRTMLGIWVENANPQDYGFVNSENAFKNYKNCFIDYYKEKHLTTFLRDIQNVGTRNINILRTQPEYKQLKWFFKVDFSDLDNVQLPIECKIQLLKRKTYTQLKRIKRLLKIHTINN